MMARRRLAHGHVELAAHALALGELPHDAEPHGIGEGLQHREHVYLRQILGVLRGQGSSLFSHCLIFVEQVCTMHVEQ